MVSTSELIPGSEETVESLACENIQEISYMIGIYVVININLSFVRYKDTTSNISIFQSYLAKDQSPLTTEILGILQYCFFCSVDPLLDS